MDQNNLIAVLLCCSLAGNKSNKALTIKEWHDVIAILYNAGYADPKCLLEQDVEDFKPLRKYHKRIKSLIALRPQVEERIKQLNELGVEIIGMGDEHYPEKLIRRMPSGAPPIFFSAGNKKLINLKSIAVVGSREAGKSGIEFAAQIGAKAAKEGFVLVSGGARGCDSISESCATKNGGSAVLFLAVPILERLKNPRIKQLVLQGKMCLLSDFNPFSVFTKSGALYRNQYIYLNSDAAFVCESSYLKGGTYKGAITNINAGKVNTFVYENCESKGNEDLIEAGGIAVNDIPASITQLIQICSINFNTLKAK